MITLPANLRAFIKDPEGKDSYPLVTYAWMLVYKQYDDKDKAIGIEAMIDYGLTQGQKVAPELGYVQLPADVVRKVAAAADQITPDYSIKVDYSVSPVNEVHPEYLKGLLDKVYGDLTHVRIAINPLVVN